MVEPAEAIDVLLVDDNISLSEMLRVAIEGAGYVVANASNGRQAIARLQTTRCRLIVTDVFMPDTDGFEVLAALRNHRLPIITMSGSAGFDPALLDRIARQLGAIRTFQKPFRIVELITAITEIIGPPQKTELPAALNAPASERADAAEPT